MLKNRHDSNIYVLGRNNFFSLKRDEKNLSKPIVKTRTVPLT